MNTMRVSMKVFLSALLIISGLSSQAQQKLEKEEQIREEEVPRQLMDTIQPFILNAHHFNYYRETDGEYKSYEIKFELEGLKYSVEFSDSFELEDVEVLVSLKTIASRTKKNIESHLEQYDKFRILRVQKQFSSETESVSSIIRKALENSEQLTIRYEIIADLKQEKTWAKKELLFDSDGSFLSSREVINRAEDFILYR